jgi:mannan endo-1,4-beta-mannosidase
VVLYADYSESGVDPKESSMIRAAFAIVNRSDTVVSLSNVTLRYYYTLEAASEQAFVCDSVSDSAVVNDCEGVKLSFGTLTEPDRYVELSFEPPDGQWVLSALGGKSGPIKVRFFKQDFSLQDQTNDYSFRASDGVDPVAEHERVTLYVDGQLAYGIEPP